MSRKWVISLFVLSAVALAAYFWSRSSALVSGIETKGGGDSLGVQFMTLATAIVGLVKPLLSSKREGQE